MTSAESVGFDLLALGALTQLALRWPILPQRKQIGAARVFPAGRSGLPHEGRGGGGGLALGLAFALGRGGPLGRLPFASAFGLPFAAVWFSCSSKARLRSSIRWDHHWVESAGNPCFC